MRTRRHFMTIILGKTLSTALQIIVSGSFVDDQGKPEIVLISPDQIKLSNKGGRQ